MRTAVVATVSLGLLMGTLTAAAAATPADSDLAASSPAQRNDISRAGNAAQWVQPPYLKRLKNGRIALKATVYLEPLVMKGPRKTDKIKFRVAVAKKSASGLKRPTAVALLPKSSLLLRDSASFKARKGTRDVQLTLPKKVSKNL
ncbi:MAG: hypothetical protein MUF33_13045, partial [Candidatus Nanopelagicales bacterium]|nr:hypothetical protein [Candidatus Nanopelagicales bacterium]